MQLGLPISIGIVGTGRVAQAFARRWAGLPEVVSVKWILGRRPEAVSSLQALLPAAPESLDKLPQSRVDVDCVVLAASDDALPSLMEHFESSFVLHFSGSAPAPKIGAVLWPIRAISSSETIDWSTLPCGLEFSGRSNPENIEEWLRTTAPNSQTMNSKERIGAHLTAVVVANFTNHLLALGQELAGRSGLEWSTFVPLIDGVWEAARRGESREAQTGPAARGDELTVGRHRVWLEENAPQLLPLYNTLTAQISTFHNSAPHDPS